MSSTSSSTSPSTSSVLVTTSAAAVAAAVTTAANASASVNDTVSTNDVAAADTSVGSSARFLDDHRVSSSSSSAATGAGSAQTSSPQPPTSLLLTEEPQQQTQPQPPKQAVYVQPQHYIKCVAIGDGAVGKTCMLHTYTTNKFPWDYEPTVFDNYAVTVHIGKQSITLGLFDTAGQEDWDKLRIMSYTATDVFIVCFSVMEPSSFLNVEEKWIPEIKQYMPNVPFVLVGTQIDLRDNLISLKDLNRKNQRPVTKEEGEKLARKLGARAYVECSALLNINVKQVFDTAIITYFQPSKPKKSRFRRLLCGWSRASELMS